MSCAFSLHALDFAIISQVCQQHDTNANSLRSVPDSQSLNDGRPLFRSDVEMQSNVAVILWAGERVRAAVRFCRGRDSAQMALVALSLLLINIPWHWIP